jgi:LacI family transcriptional regulator
MFCAQAFDFQKARAGSKVCVAAALDYSSNLVMLRVGYDDAREGEGMARRQGMAALAAAAGVSVATIDRVLNGRETVSETTRALIVDAARRIRHPALARLTDAVQAMPVLRFGVLLHKSAQEFYRNLAREMKDAALRVPGAQCDLELEFAASQAPGEVAGMMRKLGARCDVIAATAVNHPEITAAVEALKADGVPVFALLSDFAQGIRAGYVGLNNLKVGRVAGWMIGLAARDAGKVAVFVGGARWHGHDLREAGFRAYLREERPDLEVMETIVNLETRQMTYGTTLSLLAKYPNLRGIYVAGGGMEGAIAALRETRAPGQVALVVNEVTAESRAALAAGWVTMVDATPIGDLCRVVTDLMAKAAGGGPVTAGAQHFLQMQLHVSESL